MADSTPTTEAPTTAQLLRQLEEYQIIFDSTPIMFWFKDTKNNLIRVNRAAAEFEHMPMEQLAGKSGYDLYPKEQAEAFHKDDLEVIESGRPKLDIIEAHSSPVTGELMWVQTGKVPYRAANGEIKGVIAFAVDVTGQKRIEEALRQTQKNVEQKNHELERAHEFFLATLEQLTDSVKRGAPSAELLSYLKRTTQEFDRLKGQ